MAGLNLIKTEPMAITKKYIISKIPSKKNTITDEVVALLNEANNDPMFNGNEFFDTLVDYQDAMISSKASVAEFIDAIKFCAFLESGYNNTESYVRARRKDEFVISRASFPKGSPELAAITSAASRYKKSNLVKKILTQADMPIYLLFQGDRYAAVGVLAKEMINAEYSRDRISAADKLLTHVKPPENIQVELGISDGASNAIESLNAQLASVASAQIAHLKAGTMNLKEMGALKPADEDDVIEGEVD